MADIADILFGMKYCMNTSTIREQALSMPDTFNMLADCGYDGVEPWVKELDAYTAAGGQLSDLKKLAADRNLEIVDLIGFYAWSADDDAERAAALEEARRCLDMAAQLGSTYIAAPPMGWTQKGGLDLWDAVDRYRDLLAIGREYGVIPILEFWGPAQSLGHLGEALMVVAECGQSEACLLADIYHMHKKGTEHASLLHCGPETIGLVHMNDYPAVPARPDITDADRVMPGEGIAQWDVIFGALKRVGYQGHLSLELFNQELWKADPKTVAADGIAAMKKLVEQYAS